MPQEITLDTFDRALLRALQRDASLTNAGLAELVNLSPSQCSRRRTALEQAGVIEGYAARLDARKLGLGLRAIVRVNLSAHSERTDDAFAVFVAGDDAVRAAYSVSGDADYVLEVHVRDLDAFAAFIHRRLLPHPMVTQVRSEIVLQVTKEERRLPIP
jgi:DNA-binding Lrp family transcriptional regulator